MATGHGPSENILKQGYLKKCVQTTDVIPSASKQIAKNIKQRLEPNRWYVFGVRNRSPYLEYFDKEESVFTGPPLDVYDLSTFQSLSYTMGRTNTNFTFCIFLAERTIELTAPSRAHMVEWCRCLERNLRNLGLRSKNIKEDHQYTAFPVKSDYKPTKTDYDDNDELPAEPTLEEQLVANNSSDEDEAKDHDYQDATILKLDDEENSQPTLPLRPPPRVPREQKQEVHEEVFASLSTVRREEMYSNFDGFNHDVNKDEEHLFDTSSDSDIDKDVESKNNDIAQKRYSGEDQVDDIDAEDRCTSLPNIPAPPQESDTSEDSDFVSASFWLRNKRLEEEGKEDSDAPPKVPERFDSVKPKPATRKCVSMNMNNVKENGSHLSFSPSLELLGKAPALPHRNFDDGNLKFSGNRDKRVRDHKEAVVLLKEDDWFAVNRNTNACLETKLSVPNSCDRASDDDEAGVYETLAEKPVEPTKVTDGSKINNGTTQDDVYEATWQFTGARRSNSEDEDDVCCSGGKEPERLFVALPNDKADKNDCNGNVRMRNNDHSEHSHKHKSVLSKIFQRKSKDKELPERLMVTVPLDGSESAGACSNASDEPSTDGNFYSDFPNPTACSQPNNLDSDILKLSLLENGPISSQESSPIELPKRDFSQRVVRSKHVDETTRLKQNLSSSAREPLQCFNQNAYEPVDISKSVKSDYHRPRVPSPPAKTKLYKSPELDIGAEEVPIAPPRRNRKPDTGSKPSDSPKAQRVNMCTGSPPVPKKRQSVMAVMSASTKAPISSASSREPALPPRNHADSDKPALPPPPRRELVMRATSAASSVTRPKTIHLASRQQSVNQSSALTVMNLKQNQVDILKSEIESTGGLVKLISKVHFQNGLALVECFNKVWIAGWDVKKFPRLYDKFHIGDQLISINDVAVTDLSFTQKLVKNIKAENIEISIRRLPNAKVFAIQRSAEGESLGIKRDGGTAEFQPMTLLAYILLHQSLLSKIVYIDPLGLAYRQGLASKSTTMDRNSLCNWTLTEINMRPLNLFFKDSEIERRLLAVGRDISIVVQPSDFVRDLKKQLKKLKGHKDYVIH